MPASLRTALALVLLAPLGACHPPSVTERAVGVTAGIRAGEVTAEPSAEGIRIVNQTERPVAYRAYERDLAARTGVGACAGGPGCPTLAPGAAATLSWSSVDGYDAGKTAYVLYWWQVYTEPDGTVRVGYLQHVLVTR